MADAGHRGAWRLRAPAAVLALVICASLATHAPALTRSGQHRPAPSAHATLTRSGQHPPAPSAHVTLTRPGQHRPTPRAHAASSALWGISDDSPTTFVDPRFRWMHLRLARAVMAWDVMYRPAELAWRNLWLNAARADGVRPLVAFSADPKHSHWLPSPNEYTKAVRLFMRAHPWILDYTPWQEENHYTQPTSHDPRRAAEYFNALSASCRPCQVTAADVLDEPSMERWIEQFLRYARHPHIWGLHNYLDLNHGGHSQTSQFLRMVPGNVWFTETGGLVWRYEHFSHSWVVRGESYAAHAASRLGELARLSGRIRRIYYYQWRVPFTLAWAKRHHNLTWDSGLIGPNCIARLAFYVVARELGRNPRRAPHVKRNGSGECVSK